MIDTSELQSTLRLYRRLMAYVWPYKWVFLASILGMAVVSVTEGGFAWIMKPLIDGGFVKNDASSIRYVPMLIIGIFVARGLFGFMASYATNWVGRQVIFQIRSQMFSRLYIAGGGIALRWFRDQFYNTARGVSQAADEGLYDEMTALAEQIPPGCDGLFFSPHLGGRICPSDPQMRGAWVGFSWGHTQAHFFRAILESVAFEYAYYLGILRDLIPDLKLIEARAVGGGARSRVWNQIKSDVLGVPYQTLKRSEFGTWGCAMIAGRAVGVFHDLAEVATLSTAPSGAPVGPRPEMQSAYQPYVEQYIRWQKGFSEMMEAALQQPDFHHAAEVIVKYSLRLGFSRAHLFWVPTGKDINKRNLLIGIACAGRNRIREFKNVLFPFQGWFDLDLMEDVSNAVFIRTLHQENSPELKELRGYRLPVFEAAILPIRQSNLLKGLLLLDFDQIKRTLSEHERSLLNLFARQVSVVLNQASLHGREQWLLQESALIQKIGREINAKAGRRVAW